MISNFFLFALGLVLQPKRKSKQPRKKLEIFGLGTTAQKEKQATKEKIRNLYFFPFCFGLGTTAQKEKQATKEKIRNL